jgi:DNA-binding YbaB/EbfC family protein
MAEGDSSPTGGLGDLFSQLQAAQADLESQAAAMDAAVVEGHAAGGAVVVQLRGSLEAESVRIDPSIIDPADPTLLEDALLAALRDALGQVVELRSSFQSQVEPQFPSGMDLNAMVGNLGLEGILGGVDVNALMGNLGMGLDLSAFGGPNALGGLGALDDEDDEDDEDEDGQTDEQDSGVIDDEPQV